MQDNNRKQHGRRKLSSAIAARRSLDVYLPFSGNEDEKIVLPLDENAEPAVSSAGHNIVTDTDRCSSDANGVIKAKAESDAFPAEEAYQRGNTAVGEVHTAKAADTIKQADAETSDSEAPGRDFATKADREDVPDFEKVYAYIKAEYGIKETGDSEEKAPVNVKRKRPDKTGREETSLSVSDESEPDGEDSELDVQRDGASTVSARKKAARERKRKLRESRERVAAFSPDSVEPLWKAENMKSVSGVLSYSLGFVNFTGMRTLAFFMYCGLMINVYVFSPIRAGAKSASDFLKSIIIRLRMLPKTTLDDYKNFKNEARFVRSKASQFKGVRRFPVFKALSRYYIRSFTRYNRFWRTVFNFIFPIVAVIVLIVTINYRQDTTVALEISCNGKVVGYAENEQVFNDAKANALEMLSVGGGTDSVKLSDAVYSIKRVTLNQLNDASVISENLIKSAETNYVQACGIFIDGDFICAVKNEADAVTVFDKMLEQYEQQAEEGAMVAFVEEIEYVQGLYADTDDVIYDADALKRKVTSKKQTAVYYTVRPGDSLSGIAAKYDLTTSELKKLNPDVADDNIYAGNILLVSQQVNYVRVKVMKTECRTESIAYSTVKKDSSTLYKGTTKTVQKGANGTKQITELVTYIDGIKTYTSLISTKQIKAPVDKIVYVGTKAIVKSSPSSSGGSSSSSSSSVGSYSTSTSSAGFAWPVVGGYCISSRFGYRTLRGSYKFHGGVDIIRSGGNSSGLPVVASASGTVVYAGYNGGGYGYMVLIDHGNGIKTRYAHMLSGSVCVSVGQSVSRGKQIGRVGSTGYSTGPHLHFEVIVRGTKVNPLNYIG